MTRAKIVRTIAVTLVVMAATVAIDYVVNVPLGHAANYTPFTTLVIALVVGGPLSYVLSSQHINLAEAKATLTATLAERERAVQEAQDALARFRTSEQLYALLADNLVDTVSLWDGDGQRLYSSPSIERLLGYTLDHYMTLPANEGINPDDYRFIQLLVADLTHEAGPRTAQYRRKRKDGVEIWLESTYTALKDRGGLISTTRDITQRKQLELELVAALGQAKAAAAAKADFLANMTHELRTPLNAIIGFSEVLQRSDELGARDARHVDLIQSASRTLLGVINDVLDYSRLEAGGVDLDPQPFDPLAMAEATRALIGEQAAAKGLELALTAEAPPRPMVGDAPRLSRVLLNFLSNAVKFTREGGIAIRLEQIVRDGAGVLRIAVSDTGIGIPEHQIDGVFERFAQADAAVSRRFGGAGLGLAICKHLIEKMDGQIGAESRVGQGSTFWFEVPLPFAEHLAPSPAQTAPQAEFDAPLRLLLVEDNAVNRELVCTMLAPFDVVIDTANDGVEGVEAAQRLAYDLILMDVQMPVMDGLTATRRIRAAETGARAPIVAMTANVLPEQVANCLAAGMDDHVGKPIDARRLLQTVVRWTQPAA